MSLISFTSAEALYDYASTMLGKPMYGTQQQWQAWDLIYESWLQNESGIKYSQGKYWINEITDPEVGTDTLSSVGDFVNVNSSTQSNVAAGTAEAVGGGGVKTIPKTQTIVTDTATGEATIGDVCKGLKNFGVDLTTPIFNVIGNIAGGLNLCSLALNAQNLDVWHDLLNAVFYGGELPEITHEDLLDLLNVRTHRMLWTADDDLISAVPKTIADRLFTFFAQHITEIETPSGIVQTYLPDLKFSLCSFGSSQQEAPEPPSEWYYARYMKQLGNSAPYTGTIYFDHVNITDDVLKIQATDFAASIIGSGYALSDNVSTAFIESMEGVTSALNALITQYGTSHGFDTVNDFCFYKINFIFSRDPNVPKTTPVALSEIECNIRAGHNDTYEFTEDNQMICEFRDSDYLARYLKRGRDGSSYTDYGYHAYIKPWTQVNEHKSFMLFRLHYPSNEKVIGLQRSGFDVSTADFNSWFWQSEPYYIPVNGHYNSDHTESISGGIQGGYSNVSYKGYDVTYEMDDYLKKGWSFKTPTAKTPNTSNLSQGIDGVYPEWAGKVKTLSQVDRTGGEKQLKYIPAIGTFGSTNTQQIIEHGTDPSVDPDAYQDPFTPEEHKEGKINRKTPIEDVNEEIQNSVDDYNDSDVDPESAPEPISPSNPIPQYPVNPPDDPEGETDDPPTPGTMEGVTASGMVSVYNPTKQEIIDFSAWLWSPNFFDNFIKLLQDPLDAIIGLHIMYATPHTDGTDTIKVGYLDSGVSSKVVDQQFTEMDCGHIDIPEYFGTALDYEPYVQVHAYLPFVGFVSLKPNDVIGKRLYLKYGIDALTGTCLAILTTKKGNAEITLYNFAGNCAVQIPLTGGNYANVIRGITSMAVGVAGSVATGNPLGAIGGAISGVMSSHLDVSHSGTIGANAGAMGVRKPYVVITRKSAYDAAAYNQFYGYPANKTLKLGTCKGFTRVKSVHIDSIDIATDNEKTEIETLLKQGVIIK